MNKDAAEAITTRLEMIIHQNAITNELLIGILRALAPPTDVRIPPPAANQGTRPQMGFQITNTLTDADACGTMNS